MNPSKKFALASSALSFVLICPPAANANEASEAWDLSNPVREKCFEYPNGQQPANACMGQVLDAADKRMNESYHRLIGELLDADMLRASQREWLKFRDLECRFRTSGISDEGSMKPFIVGACQLDLTLKRLKDFELLDGRTSNADPTRK